MVRRLCKGAFFLLLIGSVTAAARAAAISNKASLDGASSTTAESNLGDLVADAVAAQAGADAAIVPATEIRPVAVPAGQIDTARIVDALRAPTDDSDTVVTLKLTGDQLRKAIERGVSRASNPYEGFLQISGLSVTYSAGAASGHKVQSLKIGGRGVQPGGEYRIATTRLLADGALGYFEIWGRDNLARDSGVSLSKAVASFASDHSPLDYHVEGRIQAE